MSIWPENCSQAGLVLFTPPSRLSMELVLEGPSILAHPVQIPDMASQANKRDTPLLALGWTTSPPRPCPIGSEYSDSLINKEAHMAGTGVEKMLLPTQP